MINKSTFKELVDRYLQCVDKVGLEHYVDKFEGYKFGFIANFQKNFDIDAKSLSKMIESAIENNNLVTGFHYFPRAMLLSFAEKYEIETRNALQDLFDEGKDVAARIDSFREVMDKLMAEENRKNNRSDYSFMGMRFISLLLSVRYPEKYYPVKPSEYKKFAKEMDKDFSGTSGLSHGEQYKLYAKYAGELRSFIRDNAEIQKIHSLLTRDMDFKDPEYIWMTQDVIFTSARSSKILGQELGSDTPRRSRRSISSNDVKAESFPSIVETSKFLESVELDGLKYEPYFLKPPTTIKIRSVIEKCCSGKLVLPHFQRYFDWKKEDVSDFFESIFNGYYVGSFLFWDTTRDPALGIMPIEGLSLDMEKIEPESIVLDGQQRITSLYYAIKAPDFKLKGSRSPIYFYINISSFLSPVIKTNGIIVMSPEKLSREESYKKLLFPLYELERYDEWVNGFDDFMLEESSDNNKIRQVRRIIDKRLRHMWEGFEIPYITLPRNMELAQATEIFERLNTRGKRLSVFDLLIARMYKYNIKLRDLWDATIKQHPKIDRYYKKIDKIPIYILQAMALSFSGSSSCKRKDILDIYENVYEGATFSFEEHWNEMSDYLNRSIEMLENLRMDGFGVKNEKEIPFESMIPVLTSLLKEIDSGEKKADCYRKLRMWYWASVFSNAYSQSADSRMTSDFKEMKTWFLDDSKTPNSIIDARRKFSYLNLKEEQSKNSAAYRGVMSILAIEGAKDFETSLPLENAPNNDKDHIYPKGQFGFLGGRVGSVLNMTWMSDNTNRRIKHCKKPSEYLKEFINEKYRGDEREFLKILETHFINKKAYEFMLQDEEGFDGFIEERQKAILVKICDLLGIEPLNTEPGLINPEEPFRNTVAFGEVIRSCDGYLYWADKYFSLKGLELLSQFLEIDHIKEVKILTSVARIDENFRSLFVDFRREMRNKGVDCELRIITDSRLQSQIHDRWILSKDQCFNIPSPDVVARGQYSEIRETSNRPSFGEWWQTGKDIISAWEAIKQYINQHESVERNRRGV